MVVNLTKNNKSRNSTYMPNIKTIEKYIFLTLKFKKTYNYLQLLFIKALIFQLFDIKDHNQIKTNVSNYAIRKILNHINLDSNISPNKSGCSQQHQIAYFSKKIISAEIQYKTHNAKLQAIIKTFKTYCYYPEGCKYKMFVLTNHKNLRLFMDIKNLSFCQFGQI